MEEIMFVAAVCHRACSVDCTLVGLPMKEGKRKEVVGIYIHIHPSYSVIVGRIMSCLSASMCMRWVTRRLALKDNNK